MDPQRFREAYERLQFLDERLTFKLRARGGSMGRANLEQLEDRLKDVCEYTIEIKEIVEELFLSISGKPKGEDDEE